MKNIDDKLEVKVIELETISPIHIGGTLANYGKGYIRLDRKDDKLNGNYVYLIDNDVFCEWLCYLSGNGDNLGYIKDYTEFFTGDGLDDFFKRYAKRLRLNVGDFIDKKKEFLLKVTKEEYLKHNFNGKTKESFEHNGSYYKFNKDRTATKVVNSYLSQHVKNSKGVLDAFYNHSLDQFLKDNCLKKELEKISKDDEWFKVFKGRTFIGDKNSFIQNREGEYYIPGSSIKGCFKTAVLYYILKREKDKDPNKFVNKLRNDMNQLIGKCEERDFSSTLLEKIFSSTIPQEWEKKGLHPNKEQLDFFRCIQITDAKLEKKHKDKSAKIMHSFGELATTQPLNIKSVMVTTLVNKNEVKDKLFIGDIECFTGKARFRITLDFELYNGFYPIDADKPFRTVEELMKIVNEFYANIWDEEKAFLEKDTSSLKNHIDTKTIKSFYNKKHIKTIMRIGWGTGLLGMTILSLFDKTTGIRQKIRNISSNRDNQVAPKSKRFISCNKKIPEQPLGWCNLEIKS